MDLARAAFLLAAVGFGWWGLRTHWDQIAMEVSRTSPARLVGSVVAVLLGLAITGIVWRRILVAYGHSVPARGASAIFFVGQLGKYIPGSVWALGAQADMAHRRVDVPVRTTLSVGLIFIWVHLATAVPVAALVAGGTAWPWLASPGFQAALVIMALLGVTPPALARLGDLLAAAEEPFRLRWGAALSVAGLMAGVWLLYGAAAMLVVPPEALPAAGGGMAGLAPIAGAFALSYIVGVLVVIAPAGVGVREATLVALLSPALGLPVAVATAMLIRAVHTVCDFTIAGASWLLARPGPE
jgi:hypothetical protein